MMSLPGVRMGVASGLVVGTGSDIMHPGGQWAWSRSLITS